MLLQIIARRDPGLISIRTLPFSGYAANTLLLVCDSSAVVYPAELQNLIRSGNDSLGGSETDVRRACRRRISTYAIAIGSPED